MDNWIELIRALVRPYLIYSGWGTLLGLVIYLTVKFADADDAKTLLVFITGVIATVVGYYVRDRSGKEKENPK
ncbi:MAG: hypothetical protein KAR06_02920 [Deltaproteobacteria bacterium]|nr:hypothetical protein [Deltaproteobacteria bacterium]